MKVICIRQPKNLVDPEDGASSLVKEGEVYTVSESVFDGYELVEHIGYVYAKKLFIPLSSIDETTFERNYKTQTV